MAKNGRGRAMVRLVAAAFFIERTGNRRGERVPCMKFENSNQRWRNSLEGDEVTGVNGRLSRGWRAGYRGESRVGEILDDWTIYEIKSIEDFEHSMIEDY